MQKITIKNVIRDFEKLVVLDVPDAMKELIVEQARNLFNDENEGLGLTWLNDKNDFEMKNAYSRDAIQAKINRVILEAKNGFTYKTLDTNTCKKCGTKLLFITRPSRLSFGNPLNFVYCEKCKTREGVCPECFQSDKIRELSFCNHARYECDRCNIRFD